MKHIKLAVLTAVAIAAFSAAGINHISGHAEDDDSLLMENIEALTQYEVPVFTNMTRVASDCVYTFTGKSNSTISVVIGGQTVSVSLDKEGNGSYTVKDGQVRCIGGGNEVCIPQNC